MVPLWSDLKIVREANCIEKRGMTLSKTCDPQIIEEGSQSDMYGLCVTLWRYLGSVRQSREKLVPSAPIEDSRVPASRGRKKRCGNDNVWLDQIWPK